MDPFVVELVYVSFTHGGISCTAFFHHCCTSPRHFHCSYTPIVLGVEVCARFLPSTVPRMQLLTATARLRMARIILRTTTTVLVDVDAKDRNIPFLPMRVASMATTRLFRLVVPCPCVSLSFFLSFFLFFFLGGPCKWCISLLVPSLVVHASGAFLSWYLPWWSMQVVHFSLGTFLGGTCKWCISLLVPSLVVHASGVVWMGISTPLVVVGKRRRRVVWRWTRRWRRRR